MSESVTPRRLPWPVMLFAVLLVAGVAVGLVVLTRFAKRMADDDARASFSFTIGVLDEDVADYVRATGAAPTDAADACRALTQPFAGKDGKKRGPLVAPDSMPGLRWEGMPAVFVDLWGKPLLYDPRSHRFRSLGPDGADDQGAHDDVVGR